jgi:hypothetical protein
MVERASSGNYAVEELKSIKQLQDAAKVEAPRCTGAASESSVDGEDTYERDIKECLRCCYSRPEKSKQSEVMGQNNQGR